MKRIALQEKGLWKTLFGGRRANRRREEASIVPVKLAFFILRLARCDKCG